MEGDPNQLRAIISIIVLPPFQIYKTAAPSLLRLLSQAMSGICALHVFHFIDQHMKLSKFEVVCSSQDDIASSLSRVRKGLVQLGAG